MANDIVMKVSLVDNSDLVLKALPEQIEQALIAVGAHAESYAKELCPVDTGRLRNSVTYAIAGQGAAAPEYSDNEGRSFSNSGTAPADKSLGKAQSVYVGTNVEYAVFVENGTSKMRARPFLKPAVADHVEEYKSLVKTALSG